MIELILPVSFTQPISHYTGLILGTMLSAIFSDLIVTVNSGHFGKIFVDNHFIKFWRLFFFFVILLGSFAILSDWLSPFVDSFILANLNLYFGLSSLVIGLFFVWFVNAFSYDIKTQWKWLFAVICFIITGINVALVFFGVI